MKWMAILFALGVALCWGLYGPALTLSRAPKGEWGPFKPYVFVGVAYLVIAVIGGALMMKFAFNDNFDYTGTYLPAMKWGFIAGALGALGALFLTVALTKAGGKPSYVMPIVFGGAVAVNALVAYRNLHAGDSVNPLMWVGMGLVCVGICLTTVFAPHGAAPAKPVTATPGVEVDADAQARSVVPSNRSTG